MNKTLLICALALTPLAGCQTTAQALDASQQGAIDTALSRARFEMACPAATGSVLSRKAVDPAMPMTRFGTGGPERYEYTIGIEGCGKRQTSVVVCTDTGADCFAAGSR